MSKQQAEENEADAVAETGGNLVRLLRPCRWWGRLAIASVSGLILSTAFPPLELDFLVWLALVPLLLLTPPTRIRGRALVGWLFGFAHFATCLAWLNEVGFAAGWLLALVCAFFPMFWYIAACAVSDSLSGPAACSAAARRSGDHLRLSPAHQCLLVLVLPVLWVTFEWVRSWIFTGFPWNLVGVSLWKRTPLLQVTSITGVYGLSFVIIAVNVAIACAAARWLRSRERPGFPWAFIPALALLVLVWLPSLLSPPEFGPPSGHLRTLVVQGNIPQCRQWSQEDLDLSLEVYTTLSEQHARLVLPDLIVWPETAVPAPLRWDAQYNKALRELIKKAPTHYLIGSIDYRDILGKFSTDAKTGEMRQDDHVFNTAFLFEPTGELVNFYDKIHLVPFGEYTPFERWWPWLADWIGMGRSLTAGSEFTLFELPGGVLAGVNICYEDVYPRISRQFASRGANLLITLTNDAWYAESSGSRQHLIHAVFRAVENRRPLLRSGNNSDTCLILPDGRIAGLLRDPETGNPFYRGAKVYDVPVWRGLERTWYTRFGDLFAYACALVGGVICTALLARWCARKRRLWAKITGMETGAGGGDQRG